MSIHLSEERESLWMLVAAPVIWAAHFLLSYGTAAVWCAKLASPAGSLASARVAIALYTVIALAGIAAIAWRGWSRHSFADCVLPHDFDSPDSRRRFLGFASFLLAGLSAIAVIYAALPVLFTGSCR